ncbi:M48 family metalloprotease [Flexibacterium corallicola]|uniref:M48 family metalloprotease n=1 Tax=Flexibacterium corallicola TaxID=3037259 RepID=UPI00286F4B57|nr:M48 family metalloprotease [Pseudovibrio sp. M1P-2-3]
MPEGYTGGRVLLKSICSTFRFNYSVKDLVPKLARSSVASVTALSLLFSGLPLSSAQAQSKVPLVRDAETENLLRDYARPVFRAAGLPANQVEIILVNDKSYNAFVPDSRRMFINVGVVMTAKTPEEVIGVIAHETGHITGNHLVRMRQAAANARVISVIGMILGAGAAAAGVSAGSSAVAQGGAAAAMGGGSLAQRTFLAYKRSEESAADQAALKYLERTGTSPKGMLTSFERMADAALFSARYADPYAISHPMPRDRFNALQVKAKKSRHFNKKVPSQLQQRHDMVRAKLAAFTSHPKSTYRLYPRSNKSLPAQYARAVATMKSSSGKKAARAIDKLIAQQPNNPYFYELKGQALLEGGNPAAAIAPFKKALSYMPRNPQLEIWLGFALVASENPQYLPEAKRILTTALRRDPNSHIGYTQLAIAYGRTGDTAMADLSTAKSLLARGNLRSAQQYAARAKKKMKTGSISWQQADDILSYKVNRALR